MIIQSVQQTYVFNQTQGAVTEPVNGNWLQAYCEYLGITEPVNASWLQALCNHFGITEPLYASWTIALANYYGITQPLNGSWWYAISQDPGIPPVAPPFIWSEDTRKWEAETRAWDYVTPVAPTAEFTSDVTTVLETGQVQYADTSTGIPTSWLWTFEGGTPLTSTDQNPLVTYDTAGQYDASLEATNALGSDLNTKIDYITVDAPVTDVTLTLDMFDIYGDGWNEGYFELEREASPGVWEKIEYNENPFYFGSIYQIRNFKDDGDMTGALYYKTDSSPTAGTPGIYGMTFTSYEPYVTSAYNNDPVSVSGWSACRGLRSWTVPATGNYRTVSGNAGSYAGERSYEIFNGATSVAALPSNSNLWQPGDIQTTFTL